MRNDLSIRLTGDAGQGLESSGAGFARAAARVGLHVLATPDYRSRVRGGNNYSQIRLGARPFYSGSHAVDLVVALTADSIPLHAPNIAPGGLLLVPEEMKFNESPVAADVTIVKLPLQTIAREHGDRLMTNTAAIAAMAAIIGFPLSTLQEVIRGNFAKKGERAVEGNLGVAAAAYELGAAVPDAGLRLKLPDETNPRLLMNGNQAFALGALAGGCRFISAYPMTPATSIFEWLCAVPPEYGVVTKHTEDEIAAVCMAIGASYTGARAMTTTSGGGFCLMVEALGLAGMTELPLVVVDAQRGGPSTGLPTRTEQSDLLFVINAGHGEFPRIVLAPRTTEECFESGWRALNLADRYQCPVIVLTDALMATTLRTVEPDAIDFGSVAIDRGQTIEADELAATGGYRRYEFSDDGVSPRAVPGTPQAVYSIASDEHDEAGHITEEAENRVRMMQKRMRKLETAKRELRTPEVYGPADAEFTLVAWGSTYGACRETVDQLNASGGTANLISFSDLWPLPADAVAETLNRSRKLLVVEGNYTSELAQLLRLTTGVVPDATINRYDGRPFTPEYILRAIEEEALVHSGR